MTRTIGVIDLGSNSVRLAVVRITDDRAFRVLATAKAVVRLAAALGEDGVISPAGLERTLAALQDFLRIGRTHGAAQYLAVATAAVRQAANGPEFIAEVGRRTGVAFRIISEAEESELAFLGALNTLDEQEGLLIDMGGASTELVRFAGRRPVVGTSLPYGAVNLTERFVPGGQGGADAYATLNLFLSELLATVPCVRSARQLPLIGVGGTVRTIARIDRKARSYPLDVLHNYRLSPESVEAVYRLVRSRPVAERAKIPGVGEDRADILPCGVAMIVQLLGRSGARELVVSGNGVREGLIYRHLLRQRAVPLVDDPLAYSVANLVHSYGLDEARSRETARLALALFDGLQPVHRLGPRTRACIAAAGALAEAGAAVNIYGQEQHTFYLLAHGRLYGLTHRETVITAAAAAYQRAGKVKALTDPFAVILAEGDEGVVRRLGVLTAMAREMTLFDPGAVDALGFRLHAGEAVLQLFAPAGVGGEIARLQSLAEEFRKAFGLRLIIAKETNVSRM
ncbi:MAG TPA: Ppx/GppA phosphatase family protein [Symbiobacteriaceae bacterium]|nr:Ppx/GppA phosphatase family protein [Symbiobacteriaceae bacterium]